MSSTEIDEDEDVKKCKICGEKKEGKLGNTYGIVACSSCRVFFIRVVKGTSKITCTKGDNCRMTPKGLKCTACRYSKCIKVGMKPQFVGSRKEENPKYKVERFNAIDVTYWKYELNLYLLPDGLKIINNLQNATSAQNFADLFLFFERWAANKEGKSATDVPVNIDVNLADVLMNPTLCASRESAAWDSRYQISYDRTYSYKHTYCRNVTMHADIVNGIPEFHHLEMKDRLKFFQQSFATDILLSMQFSRWKLPYISIQNCSVKRLDRFGFPPEVKEMFGRIVFYVTNAYEKNIFPIFDEIKLTDQEWILVKLISIFYSVSGCSNEGGEIIKALKTSYSSVLAKLINEANPDLSEEAKITRFRKILNTIKTITALGKQYNDFFTSFVTIYQKELKGNLSYDIHMRYL